MILKNAKMQRVVDTNPINTKEAPLKNTSWVIHDVFLGRKHNTRSDLDKTLAVSFCAGESDGIGAGVGVVGGGLMHCPPSLTMPI